MKRLAWVALGFVVFVIILMDTPWTATNKPDPPGPLPGPAGGVAVTTSGTPSTPVVTVALTPTR